MTPSAQIIEVLDYLGQKIGITIDWTQANVMPYMQELFAKFIKWEVSTSIAWIVIMVILAVVAVIFSIIINDEVLCTITVFLIFAAIIVISCQTFDIIEACTFPEKTLYDFIRLRYQ